MKKLHPASLLNLWSDKNKHKTPEIARNLTFSGLFIFQYSHYQKYIFKSIAYLVNSVL
jgi:hypothetical protein